MKFTVREIRERIALATSFSDPEVLRLAAGKVDVYIREMKEALLSCPACSDISEGSCGNCLKIQETLGWALEKRKELK